MSLQWTLVATFLYAEVAFMVILLLPLIRPTTWQKIFRSRLVNALTSYAGLYFNIILFILVLLLADAIREMVKYKATLNLPTKEPGFHHGQVELIKELRAQRNFHISGTALFLWFVIKRLLALISQSAQLMAESEASRKQAESASRAATELLKESKSDDKTKTTTKDDKTTEKEDELKKLNKELQISKLDLEAMKTQAENVSKEYDNLLKEHARLQAKLEKYEDKNESKKSS